MSATPAPVTGGLNRSLLSDQAYDLLKSRLIAREYAPGTRLVESEIARQLAVSQAPVRDALRRLAHEGLVLQLPRRGSFVAEVSAEEVRDAYALRAALEELAVKEAMKHMDDSLIDALENDITTMLKAAADDSMERLVDAAVPKAVEPRNRGVRVPQWRSAPVDLFVESAANPDVGSDWQFGPTAVGS